MPAFLLYGLLLGTGQTLATLVVFALGLHASAADFPRAQGVENVLGFIVLIACVALGLRAARIRRDARGEESDFGAGARSALGLALVGALVTGLGQALYVGVINPAFSEVLRQMLLESVAPRMAELPPETAEGHRQAIELAVHPAGRGLAIGLNTFLFGTVLGLLCALIFRAAVRRDEAAAARPGA